MGDVALPQVGGDGQERDDRRPGWWWVKMRTGVTGRRVHYFVERGSSMCGRHRDGHVLEQSPAEFEKCKACAKIAQPKSTTEAQRAQR